LPSHAISKGYEKSGPPRDAAIRLKLTIEVPPEVTPENRSCHVGERARLVSSSAKFAKFRLGELGDAREYVQ